MPVTGAGKRERETGDDGQNKPKRRRSSENPAKREQELVASCPNQSWKPYAEDLLKSGFAIFRNVLSGEKVDELLHGPTVGSVSDEAADKRRTLRERTSVQNWQGAIKSVGSRIRTNKSRTAETVVAPLVSRAAGRYDMPLPPSVKEPMEKWLCDSGLLGFMRHLCPRGSLRTQDILLSKSGSERQKIHTDSSWVGRKQVNPSPHYFTILIPLTQQDKATGGTRIWPGSHKYAEYPLDEHANYVDTIAPLLCVGDALVFDGLLSHCGMENTSGIDDQVPRDRYFFYAAFSSAHDPNTDVTGF